MTTPFTRAAAIIAVVLLTPTVALSLAPRTAEAQLQEAAHQ